MKLFVTGFGPFGEIAGNPSSILAETSGYPHRILEVSYRAVDHFLDREFCRPKYDALLLIGVNAKATKLRLESRGINACGPAPDVLGQVGPGVICPSGPQTKATTLWRSEHYGLEGFTKSTSAGRYLCNYLFFRALLELPHHQVGFLHIPLAETLPIQNQQGYLEKLLKTL